jgi:hypothetical protein
VYIGAARGSAAMTSVQVGNERCRAISNLFFTSCAGLFAGSAVRMWEASGPDVAAAAWMVVALVLGFFGWQTLGLLAPEEMG